MSDSYSAHTVLLLHMNGIGGSTAFTDSSGFPKTMTPYGTAAISAAQSKWNGSSGAFYGIGDYLTAPDRNDWAFGTGDFTMESWFFQTAFATNHAFGSALMDSRDANRLYQGFALFCNASGVITAWDANSVSHQSSSGSILVNEWNHIAASRCGATQKVFVNGIEKISYSSSYNHTGQQLTIGTAVDYKDTSSNFKYVGYIQDLRITNSAARYTADFTPTTESFPDPDPITGLIMPSALRRDLEFGGRYQIVGTAQRLGASARKRVRLHDRRTGMLVREVWSATDGSFSFTDLKNAPEAYIVMELDDLANNPWLDPACADRVTPEIMP